MNLDGLDSRYFAQIVLFLHSFGLDLHRLCMYVNMGICKKNL